VVLIVTAPVELPNDESANTARCVAEDDPITNSGFAAPSEARGFIETNPQGDEVPNPTFPVKLLVFENVLKSVRSVEEADVPDDVSTQIRPAEVVFRVPTVDVAREIPPVVPLIDRADVEVVAVPATVVVVR
jgi:hypothetical protein